MVGGCKGACGGDVRDPGQGGVVGEAEGEGGEEGIGVCSEGV